MWINKASSVWGPNWSNSSCSSGVNKCWRYDNSSSVKLESWIPSRRRPLTNGNQKEISTALSKQKLRFSDFFSCSFLSFPCGRSIKVGRNCLRDDGLLRTNDIDLCKWVDIKHSRGWTYTLPRVNQFPWRYAFDLIRVLEKIDILL